MLKRAAAVGGNAVSGSQDGVRIVEAHDDVAAAGGNRGLAVRVTVDVGGGVIHADVLPGRRRQGPDRARERRAGRPRAGRRRQQPGGAQDGPLSRGGKPPEDFGLQKRGQIRAVLDEQKRVDVPRKRAGPDLSRLDGIGSCREEEESEDGQKSGRVS